MAVDYIAPTAIVETAPGFGPFDLPDSGDWVELVMADGGTRLRGFSNTRGRRDRYDTFDASTAVFTLDNNDGELDEFDPSGSTVTGTDGQALTPIRFRLTDNDTATTSTIWSGFITDGWEPGPPSERERTVTVRAIDWMGWAARRPMPQSMLATKILLETPNLWWRGRMDVPRISTSGGEVLDYGTESGVIGTHPGTMLAGVAEMAESLAGDDDPGMRLFTNARIEATGTVTGGPTGFEVVALIKIKDLGGVGRNIAVGHIGSAAGNPRWRVRVGTTGHISCSEYDAGGAIVATATVAIPHSDGQPHLIRCGSDGTTLYVRTDLGVDNAVSSGSWVGAGNITFVSGTASDIRCLVDELAYYSGNTTSLGTDMESLLEGDETSFRDTERILFRLETLTYLSGIGSPGDPWDLDFFEPLFGTSSTAVGGYVITDNLAAAIQATGEALCGGAFATRTGEVQVYGYGDRTSLYGGGIELSTEDPLPADHFRFAGGGPSGRKVDRVINEIRSASGAILATDPTSIATYGVQSMTLPTNNTSATFVGYANAIVAARKDSTPEIDDVVLQPWGDQALTTKVISDLELGGLCNVVHGADFGAAPFDLSDWLPDPILVGESWSWVNGIDWRITLTIA